MQRFMTYVHSHYSVMNVMNVHRIRTNLEQAKLFIPPDMHYSSVDPCLRFPQALPCFFFCLFVLFCFFFVFFD